IGIEKTERVRRFDDAHTGGALLIDDRIAKLLHTRPMHFGTEMMLGVIAVEEPDPIVELVVATHTPGDWLIGITTVMPVVAVQIREAVTEVPKEKKETNVMPVENAERHECAEEQDDL